jgi:hypothetical protein
MRWRLSGIAERVARARIAAFHATREPGNSLCRASVRERLRRDASLRSLLQPVVANCGGRIQTFLDIAGIELDPPRGKPSGLA